MDAGAWRALTSGREYKRFDAALRAKHKGGWKYAVTATLKGRLDIAERVGRIRDPVTGKVTGYEGFGHPVPFARLDLIRFGGQCD